MPFYLRKVVQFSSSSLALLMAALVLLAPASALAQTPSVTIERVDAEVDEGDQVQFRVNRNGGTESIPLEVTVDFTQNGDFIASDQPTRQTTLLVPSVLSVQTDDDTVGEAHGSVTATIAAGTGYTIGSPSSATVTVTDDDLPVLSIVADAETVQEGDTATFKLRREGPVTNQVTASLSTAYRPFGILESEDEGEPLQPHRLHDSHR